MLLFFTIILSSCSKKEEDTDDYSDKFKVVLNQVNRFNDEKKPAEGLQYLDSEFKRIKRPTSADYFEAYRLKYIYHHEVSHDLKKELLYADSMLKMAKKGINSKNYVTNYAQAKFALGDAYYDLSLFNDSYQCYYQGYFMGKFYLKNKILSDYTYRMGMVMFKHAHYSEAVNYFKESYRQGLHSKNIFGSFYQRQEILNYIGESYKIEGKLDSASTYFDKTIAYINKNSERFKSEAVPIDIARAVVYGNQGEIAMLRGQKDQAENLFQKSIAINSKKGNDNYNAELVSINLGKLYISTGQYKPFFSLFTNLRKLLNNVKNEDAETNWNWLMSRYYLDKKEPGKAFIYLQNYTLIKDSIIKSSSSLKEINVIQQQANYDKQYRVKTLENNYKQQLIYISMAITCAVMGLFIILLARKSWKKSKQMQGLLVQ